MEAQDESKQLPFSQVYLQTHSEEAWTVSTFDIPSPPGTNNRFLLSGGDDCALKTSLLDLAPSTSGPDFSPDLKILTSLPIDGWTDAKSYNGGVIAILPLSPTLITSPNPSFPDQLETTIPLLTGSYDDTIRLYLINPSTMLRRPILDTRLGGGVWRLKVMDEYDTATKHHFIILASCMHAGVRILRVCYDAASTSTVGWTIDVIARFEKGHSSMVYCCDFLREEGAGAYTVVSTSFYDKKICTWGFVDRVKKKFSGEMNVHQENGSWELLGMQGTSVSSTSTVGWVKEDGQWKMR
jgi:diphthamide biosynthesis protein 7